MYIDIPTLYNSSMDRNIHSTGDQLLKMIQDKYVGYHPILHAADIAHDSDAPLNITMDAIKVMLKYTTPEVKSIDISARLSGGLDRLEMMAFGLDDLEDEDEREAGVIVEESLLPAPC